MATFLPRLAALVIVLGAIGWLAAQSTGPADAEPFRRVVVAEDRMPALRAQVDQGSLVELSPEAFEAGLKAKRPATASPSLVSTLYRAKLVVADGDGHLQGTGEWVVHGRGELRLPGFRAAVRQAKWSDGTEAVLYEHPLDGQPHLHVPAADRTLNLDWSARGMPEPGELRFDLRLPASPIARLELELPVGMTPILSLGDVLLTGPTVTGDSALWQVSFGGQSRLEVILRRDASGKVPLFTRVQSRHAIAGTEAESRSEFVVEAAKAGVADLFFAHDRGFAVASVSVNNLQGWEATTRDGTPGILVRLREPTRSATVVIVGRSPVAADGRWACPLLTLADGVSRGEKIRLAVSPAWRVRDWSPGSYSITRAELAGDRTHVIDLEPGPGPSRPPTMTVARRTGGWSASQEAEWTIDAEGERLLVRISLAGDAPRPLRFRMPDGWDVDRVESAGRELAWTHVGGSPRRLEIERGPSAKGDALIVRLKLSVTPTGDIALPDLYPEGADTRSGQLSIRVDPSWALRLSDGDGAATRALGPTPLSGTATVSPRADRTRITIESDLVPGREKIRATARLTIVPGGVPVTRITLWSPSPILGPLQWRDEAGRLVAEAIPDIEAQTRMMTQARSSTAMLSLRAWRVRFPEPIDRPTTLTTSYSFEAGGKQALLQADARRFEASQPGGIGAPQREATGTAPSPATGMTMSSDVRDVRLLTVIDDSGRRTVTLRYTAPRDRQKRVPWDLPAEASEIGVTVDGRPVPFKEISPGRHLDLSLTPSDVPVTVEVRFAQPGYVAGLPRIVETMLPDALGSRPDLSLAWHIGPAWGVVRSGGSQPAHDTRLPLPDWRRFIRAEGGQDTEGEVPPGWTIVTKDEAGSPIILYPKERTRRVAWIASSLLAAAVWVFVRDVRRRRIILLALIAVALGGFWVLPSLTADVFAPLLFAATVAALLPERWRGARPVPPTVVATMLFVGMLQAAPAEEVVTVVVDSRGQPKAVFVPPALLDRLHGPQTPPPVVIAAADYSGKADAGTAILTARFRLHAFVDGPSTIVVPLAGVRPRSVTLDGAEVRDVEAVAGGLQFTVAGKGPHALDVAFAVPVGAAREREAKFAVPEVPTTRVRFEVPAPGGPPQVTNWRGAARTSKTATGLTLDADCGSGPTLAIRWAAGDDREPPQALAQSALWQFGPASATLSAAFDFRASGSAPQEIALWMPADAEVTRVIARPGSALPGAATRLVDWSLAPAEGTHRRLTARVVAPPSGRLTLFVEMATVAPLGERATFQVPRPMSGGVGGLVGVQVLGREATAEAEGVADVAADRRAGIAWPTADDTPFAGKVTHAFTTSAGKPARITLTRKPSLAVRSVSGDVHWTVGQRAATARVETTWTGNATSFLEWTVPDDVTIAGVTTKNLLSWSQSRGRVQVWLDRPVDAATVTWHAQKPLPAGRSTITLPTFGFVAHSTDVKTRARSDSGEVLLPDGGASLPSNVVGEVVWNTVGEQRLTALPPIRVPLPAATQVRTADDGFETRTRIDVSPLPRDRPHLLRVALGEATTRPAWVEVPSGWSIAELPSAGGGRRWDVLIPRDRAENSLRLIAEQPEEGGWLHAAWRVGHGPLRPAQLRETIRLDDSERRMTESRGLVPVEGAWQATEPDWQVRLVVPTVEPPSPPAEPTSEEVVPPDRPFRWGLLGASIAWCVALAAVVPRRAALFPTLAAVIAAAAMGPPAAAFWVVALFVLPVSRLRGRRPARSGP